MYIICVFFRKLLDAVKKLQAWKFSLFFFSWGVTGCQNRQNCRWRKNSRRERNFGTGVNCCEDPRWLTREIGTNVLRKPSCEFLHTRLNGHVAKLYVVAYPFSHLYCSSIGSFSSRYKSSIKTSIIFDMFRFQFTQKLIPNLLAIINIHILMIQILWLSSHFCWKKD